MSRPSSLSRPLGRYQATVDPAEALALRQDVEVLRELGVEMRPRGESSYTLLCRVTLKTLAMFYKE